MTESAIVLAGGAGLRMQPLTDDCPKPLLPLGAEPLIGYQLRRLAAVGVRRVVLAIGYLAPRFESMLGDGDQWGLELHHLAEREPLGTGGALCAAIEQLPEAERVLVLNGDLLSSHDLAAQLQASGEAGVCLHVRPVPDVAPYGAVTCDDTGRVRGFAEKTGRGPGLVNAGTYVARADLLRALPTGPSSWERQVVPDLIDGGAELIAWQGDGYFRDVGTPEAYRLACVDAVTGALPGSLCTSDGAFVAPGARVAPDAVLTGGCSVHAGAVVGSGARLDRSVVLAGAQVGANASLARCVVASGVMVPGGTRWHEQVVTAELTDG